VSDPVLVAGTIAMNKIDKASVEGGVREASQQVTVEHTPYRKAFCGRHSRVRIEAQ